MFVAGHIIPRFKMLQNQIGRNANIGWFCL
jgi:hypothetical protein